MSGSTEDARFVSRALQLAEEGRGGVEPNPLVGCLLVREHRVVGEGYHARFGGPHAEVVALEQAGSSAEGSTAYVTLEPCSHEGKTPPCTRALIQARVRRVVACCEDPYPEVAGRGFRQLREAGIAVDVGCLADQAREQNAAYRCRILRGRPWVHAKWAMSLDGRIATRTGHSQWISNEASRRRVHDLRGRMDAILVGRGTATADNPQLTARPPGPRVAVRIVLDTRAQLDLESRLVQTAREIPVWLVAGPAAPTDRIRQIESAGCRVIVLEEDHRVDRLRALLEQLGSAGMTNLLVEGGGEVLGSFHDAQCLDELHVFVGNCVIGGSDAPGPLSGSGVATLGEALRLKTFHAESLGNDVYITGRSGELA